MIKNNLNVLICLLNVNVIYGIHQTHINVYYICNIPCDITLFHMNSSLMFSQIHL